MKRILCHDWLPEQARWHYLAHSGLPAVSQKKIVFIFHIINPLLTKLVQTRWLDIGLILFCVFMDRDSELGQYPAILTSRLVLPITHISCLLHATEIEVGSDKFGMCPSVPTSASA